jgi:hypothetical protein
VDAENCGSVSTRGVTELFGVEKKWFGITFALRQKIPFTLNPELLYNRDIFSPSFLMNSATLYVVIFLSL